MERLLVLDLERKETPLEQDLLIPLLNSLGLQKCNNEEILKYLLTDFENYLKAGSITIQDVYVLMRALAAVDMLDGEVTKELVHYLVKKGYDSDDILKLSDGKLSGYRRGIHFTMLIANSKPTLKDR